MSAEVRESELSLFQAFLSKHFGLCFDPMHVESLRRTLQSRMEQRGCDRFHSYLELLTSSESAREELRKLAQEVTITETSFFRCQPHYDAFGEVAIPDRLKARAGQELQILSAGCSSGEEAYSAAIALRERFGTELSRSIRIHAIDINTRALVNAAQGRYSSWSLRSTPSELVGKYFDRMGREHVLNERIRESVTFEERNLLAEDSGFWQPGRFDIVFCRNVMIYFPQEAIQIVIEKLTSALAPGGYLFLGPAESLRGYSSDFEVRHSHGTFYYQRKASPDHGTLLESSWWNKIESSYRRISMLVSAGTRDSWRSAPDLEELCAKVGEERFEEVAQEIANLPPAMQDEPTVQLIRAILYKSRGKIETSLRVCQSIFSSSPDHADARHLSSLCHELLGELDEAVRQEESAVAHDPGFALAWLHLGLLRRRRGQKEQAVDAIAMAERLLERETGQRISLFGGGIPRAGLVRLCQLELQSLRSGESS